MKKTFKSVLSSVFPAISTVFLVSVLFGGCAKPYQVPDISAPTGESQAAKIILQGDVARNFPDRVNIDGAYLCDSFGVMLGRNVCPTGKEGQNPEELRLQTYVRPGMREIELVWSGGELPNRQGAPLDIHRSFKREFRTGFVYQCGIATLFCTEIPILAEPLPGAEKKSSTTPSPAEATPVDPPPSAVGCRNDMDCKGERICEKGACVYPPARENDPPQEKE